MGADQVTTLPQLFVVAMSCGCMRSTAFYPAVGETMDCPDHGEQTVTRRGHFVHRSEIDATAHKASDNQ
jgi:hypothetical protein